MSLTAKQRLAAEASFASENGLSVAASRLSHLAKSVNQSAVLSYEQCEDVVFATRQRKFDHIKMVTFINTCRE
jgi:hypothetical protein